MPNIVPNGNGEPHTTQRGPGGKLLRWIADKTLATVWQRIFWSALVSLAGTAFFGEVKTIHGLAGVVGFFVIAAFLIFFGLLLISALRERRGERSVAAKPLVNALSAPASTLAILAPLETDERGVYCFRVKNQTATGTKIWAKLIAADPSFTRPALPLQLAAHGSGGETDAPCEPGGEVLFELLRALPGEGVIPLRQAGLSHTSRNDIPKQRYKLTIRAYGEHGEAVEQVIDFDPEPPVAHRAKVTLGSQ